MKATNAPEADQFLKGEPYRAGWELPGLSPDHSGGRLASD